MVYSFDRFRAESGITAVNKFRTAKILKYFFFQRFQRSLFICISGKACPRASSRFYLVEGDSKKPEGTNILHDIKPVGHNPSFDQNGT